MFELKLFAWKVLVLVASYKLSIKGVDCANILFLAGIASPSHHLWNREITFALAERGHNITVISPRCDKNSSANVHYLQINGDYQKLYGNIFKHVTESEQRPAPWRDIINFHLFCAQTSGGKSNTGNHFITNKITNWNVCHF